MGQGGGRCGNVDFFFSSCPCAGNVRSRCDCDLVEPWFSHVATILLRKV